MSAPYGAPHGWMERGLQPINRFVPAVAGRIVSVIVDGDVYACDIPFKAGSKIQLSMAYAESVTTIYKKQP